MKLLSTCRIITPDHTANHSRPQGRLRAATQSHQSILQTPAGTRQASSAYVVDQAVQVNGGGLLCVHADDVAAGLDEVGHPLLRLHNHPAMQEEILRSPNSAPQLLQVVLLKHSTMLGAHRTVPHPTCSTALIQSITELQACGRVAGPNRGASSSPQWRGTATAGWLETRGLVRSHNDQRDFDGQGPKQE